MRPPGRLVAAAADRGVTLGEAAPSPRLSSCTSHMEPPGLESDPISPPADGWMRVKKKKDHRQADIHAHIYMCTRNARNENTLAAAKPRVVKCHCRTAGWLSCVPEERRHTLPFSAARNDWRHLRTLRRSSGTRQHHSPTPPPPQ